MNIPASSFNDSSERRSSLIRSLSDFSKQHRAAHWTGSFANFLEAIFPADPHGIARSSHQYVWDMMRSEGFDDTKGRLRCQLFEDELYGINDTIERLVDYFKAASAGSEVGRRLLLLLGPPSGGKSSLVILLKRGLEEYSHTDAGAMYAIHGCPVHESPLHLVPHTLRAQFRNSYGIDIAGELCPRCVSRLGQEFSGDFMQMPVERLFISEAGRVGVGTYAPHDPTTADIADLVGSVDLSKVSEYGDEGDPRAWSWSGAVFAASRGMLEMIEILKVKREFLYLLLTRLQEGEERDADNVKKVRVYAGEDVEGVPQSEIEKMRARSPDEGLSGVSPRFVINALSNAIIQSHAKSLTTMDVLLALKDGIESDVRIDGKKKRKWVDFLVMVRKDFYNRWVKEDVHKALFVSFEQEAQQLLDKYLDEVEATLDNRSVKDPITGEERKPDERFLRSVEEKIRISESGKLSFRQEVVRKAMGAYKRSEKFTLDSHAPLHDAVEQYLFEQRRDVLRLVSSTTRPDDETRQKISVVEKRLVDEYGYDAHSAREALNYVTSLLAQE